jgi:RNA polymerase sigma-70 factor, ECF subfamily
VKFPATFFRAGHLPKRLCGGKALGGREPLLKSETSEIIRRARSGDRGAFREIHEEYGKRILNFIYRMVDSREDAEDLTQNTFLRAFQELRSLQDIGRFEAWLYRIARNEVYQAFRKKRSEPVAADPVPERDDGESQLEMRDSRENPQERVLHGELGSTIRKVLSGLPPKTREVFVLAVIHEMSYSEIAEITGRSLLAVKTDIFRARAASRKHLARYIES